MSKPIISIVLGSYNRLPFLKLTLQSIRQELHDTPHEIIIVDGGSTDGTLDFLVSQKDVITIVQHNRGTWENKPIERRSWGYFMNLAFKCAQGEYVCMVSDDCILVPGAIKNAVTLADSERAAGKKVGAAAFYWREWSKEEAYHVGYTLGEKLYVNHGLFLNDALKDVDYIDEENFFFYNGDGDLCLKMWHKGYEVIASPDSYTEHYPHANVAVRATNYDRQRQDLKKYLAKWDGIFYDKALNNLGKIETKLFYDAHKTGEQFLLEHQEILKKNPKIMQGKPAYARVAQRCVWIGRAVKARVHRFLKGF